MIFTQTPLPGAYVLEPEKISDHRGFFARIWCKHELQAHGLSGELCQSNVGFSHRAGTVRGLHFQTPPHAEVKIVRCTRGSVFDVIVDVRPDSPSYQHWFGVHLTAENRKMLYVPKGMATGYMTLEDDTEINYHTSERFAPHAATGIRFDDPAVGIAWPLKVTAISEQDRSWPLIQPVSL